MSSTAARLAQGGASFIFMSIFPSSACYASVHPEIVCCFTASLPNSTMLMNCSCNGGPIAQLRSPRISPGGSKRQCAPLVRTPRAASDSMSETEAGSTRIPKSEAAAAAGLKQASVSPLQDQFEAQELIAELKDTSQLWKRGEVLTAAQLIGIALVVLRPFQLTDLTNFVGMLLLIGGLSAMVLGQQFLGRNLSPLPAPRKSSELVTSGVYSYIRHPMYSGLITASFGLAALTHDETRLVLAALLWLVLEQKVQFEEKLLVERHGEAYKQYQSSVKKFWPYIY